METLNKTIKALENCQVGTKCDKCPYYQFDHCRTLLDDAILKLLKEYKAIKPLVDDISEQLHNTAKQFRRTER